MWQILFTGEVSHNFNVLEYNSSKILLPKLKTHIRNSQIKHMVIAIKYDQT